MMKNVETQTVEMEADDAKKLLIKLYGLTGRRAPAQFVEEEGTIIEQMECELEAIRAVRDNLYEDSRMGDEVLSIIWNNDFMHIQEMIFQQVPPAYKRKYKNMFDGEKAIRADMELKDLIDDIHKIDCSGSL